MEAARATDSDRGHAAGAGARKIFGRVVGHVGACLWRGGERPAGEDVGGGRGFGRGDFGGEDGAVDPWDEAECLKFGAL